MVQPDASTTYHQPSRFRSGGEDKTNFWTGLVVGLVATGLQVLHVHQPRVTDCQALVYHPCPAVARRLGNR
jgi:hypothetical protein